MARAEYLVLGLLLLPLLCSAKFSERRIMLQGRSIDTLDHAREPRVELADGQRAEFLVQLQPPVTAAKVKQVEQATGVHFVDGVRIPHHSLLLVATEEQVAKVEAAKNVIWVGDFAAHYKYPAALEEWQAQYLTSAMTADLLVVLYSIASKDAAQRLVGAWASQMNREEGVTMSLTAVERVDRVRVTVPTKKFMATVQWLAKQVGSLWIEPAMDHRSFANKATGITESGVPQPSSFIIAQGVDGGGSKPEIVALADTGLAYSNCYFNQTTTPTSAFDVNSKIVCYDVDGGDTTDANGHGTLMAALIVGDPDGSDYHGMAPGAKLAFTDISIGTGGNYTGPSDIIAYMDKARSTYGSYIVVGAYGSTAPVTWYSTRDQDVDNQLSLFPTFIAVFAAGNYGQTSGTSNVPGKQLASPGLAKNVISVGASQNELSSVASAALANGDTARQNAIIADPSQYGRNVLAPFSSKGPAPDGRFKPDVVAPGMGVYSSSLGACATTAAFEGTSVAAALVGGAVTLVRQYLRLGYRNTGTRVQTDEITPSAALVKAAIVNSGVGLDGYSVATGQFVGTQNQIPHPAYGFGRVQLDNVLYFDGTAFDTKTIFQESSVGITSGATQLFCFTVDNSTRSLRATLAWTDPLGSIIAGFALTNNLDFVLMDPNGRVYFSNGLSTFDDINNVESVGIDSPITGTWTAYVYGHSIDDAVTTGGQQFGLVISGFVSSAACVSSNCPHACNGQGTCDAGVCTCSGGRFGVDCSLTACPNNCSAADGSFNGICNSITSECECAPAFGGADCRLPANESTVTIVKGRKGLSNGAVAGIAVGTFFAGAILCGALGFVAAIQYLIWKRKSHKKLLEEGGGKKAGGAGL